LTHCDCLPNKNVSESVNRQRMSDQRLASLDVSNFAITILNLIVRSLLTQLLRLSQHPYTCSGGTMTTKQFFS